MGRQECMERWAQRHCVNHHRGSVVEFEPDDFEQVACCVGTDSEDPWRSAAGFEFVSVLAVAETLHVRLLMQQQAKLSDLTFVPPESLTDCGIP